MYDSYLERSIKECKRIRRQSKCQPLELIGLTGDSPTPTKLNRFWASSKNNENFQTLPRTFVKDYFRAKSMPTFKRGVCKWFNKALPRTSLLYRGRRWKNNPTCCWCNQERVSTSCLLKWLCCGWLLALLHTWFSPNRSHKNLNSGLDWPKDAFHSSLWTGQASR